MRSNVAQVGGKYLFCYDESHFASPQDELAGCRAGDITVLSWIWQPNCTETLRGLLALTEHKTV